MKRARLGREPIEIIESIPFSQTIFLIASGKNYAQIISQERKIAPSPAVKQLKQLEKAGFIVSKKEKLLNKTIYSVNWSRIVKAFIELVEKRKKNYEPFLEKYEVKSGVFGFKAEYFQGLQLDLLKEKRIIKNEYLNRAIRNIFIFAYESRMNMDFNISFLLDNIIKEPEMLNHFLEIMFTSKQDIDDELSKTKDGRDYQELMFIFQKLKLHPLFFSASYSHGMKRTMEQYEKDFKEVKEMEEREAKERGEK